MKHYLHPEDTLFRNRDIFELDFIPEMFNYRDGQLGDLAFALRPGIQGSCPLNTVIRGLPGTGKTTAIRRIFREVEKTTHRLVPVYVNCQTERSKFAIFSKIYGKLHGHQPSPTGTPIRQVIYDTGRTLSERKIVLIVCLDDANYLLPGNVLNDVLYTLLRLYEEFPNARVGVILTMSAVEIDIRQVIDPCVISVLQPEEIYFPPYSEEEIRSILLDRIKLGIHPGVIPADVFDIIIENTMRSGDMRVGFDLVKRSVMAAERAGRSVVDAADVTNSYRESELIHLIASIRVLSTEDRRLLAHIAGMSLESDNCLTSGSVFESAADYMKISYSNFFEKIRKLDDMRLIDLSYVTNKGRTREIALRYDAEKVVKACGKLKMFLPLGIQCVMMGWLVSMTDIGSGIVGNIC